MMGVVKITPYIPYYMSDGNIVLRKWREPFVDRMGNKAELTWVQYRTKPKKGKKEKIIEVVIQVKWE